MGDGEGKGGAAEREARLKAALRANLLKRKARDRAEGADGGAAEGADPPKAPAE